MYVDWLEWFFPIMMKIFILADLMMLMGKPRGEGEGCVFLYLIFRIVHCPLPPPPNRKVTWMAQ